MISAIAAVARVALDLAADLLRDAMRERRPSTPPGRASVRDVDRMAEDARKRRPAKPD